ncbi:hypothetical protein RJ639_020822 [Escallonia herrerae]|uniref:Reverse transcriptase Ty1/copia-type domain-containing protein n=1 Tax=Escallonia herrerae TaxID=1293975 RepID=A0AA89AEH0_9ASTE|nr:hypothetical protein RJ639_020822 [Escallonia herrerae]
MLMEFSRYFGVLARKMVKLKATKTKALLTVEARFDPSDLPCPLALMSILKENMLGAAVFLGDFGEMMVEMDGVCKAGIVKANPKYAFILSAIPQEPKTMKSAFKHPGWKQAMVEEMQALIANDTLDLVPHSSLFVDCHGNQIMILLLYVDDMILTGNNNALLDEFTADLGRMFSMKDLGPLHFFLGIQVNRTPDGLFLHQSKYAGDLLQCAMMVDSKPIANPTAPKSFSLKNKDSLFHDPTLFRSIVGGLQYLTMTRPDLSYAINVVCHHMHHPTQAAFQLMKRILRYVKGTTQLGLQIRSASSLDLYAFCDAD